MTPDILRIQMVQELADGKCGDTWDFRSLHYHDKAPTEQGREKNLKRGWREMQGFHFPDLGK